MCFLHLEKFINGAWRPIAASIILPLSRHGYRSITLPNEAERVSITDLDGSDIISEFDMKRRFPLAGANRYLLIDTWIVDQSYRRAGYGKTDVSGGYANTLVLKHISMFWNAANGFQRTTFLMSAVTQRSR